MNFEFLVNRFKFIIFIQLSLAILKFISVLWGNRNDQWTPLTNLKDSRRTLKLNWALWTVLGKFFSKKQSDNLIWLNSLCNNPVVLDTFTSSSKTLMADLCPFYSLKTNFTQISTIQVILRFIICVLTTLNICHFIFRAFNKTTQS